MFAFLDHYVRGEDNGFPDETPRVRYYTMGRNEWSSADAWPPAEAEFVDFHLASDGAANSVFGDGAWCAARRRAQRTTRSPTTP
jgi:predicted acyl esterase